jgi:Tfp pilus assembly protein PilF
VIHLDANFFVAYALLAGLYGKRGMFAEALAAAEKAFMLAPFLPAVIGSYGGLLVRLGQPERGQEVIRTLGAGEASGAPAGLALFHLCSGDTDRAADWFEKAITERDAVAQGMLQGVPGEPMRSSPRWPKLAAMMNLPAESS